MANGFGDLKPQQGTAPSSQPGLDELLQQARVRQAQQFAQGPSEGQKLMDIGEQIAAGYRGGRDFSQVAQLQSQRGLAQDQALQQFLSHQDNLSMQQQQERRLTLQQIHAQALAEDNHAAQVMQQITGGNTNDIGELSAWWANYLQSIGQDDDDFDPMAVRQAFAEEYTKGINEGRYEGPTEVLSERDKLGITGDQTMAQIGARGEQARRTAKEQLELDKKLATHEARLKGGEAGKGKNWMISTPGGGLQQVISYDNGNTYAVGRDESGNPINKPMPLDAYDITGPTIHETVTNARAVTDIANKLDQLNQGAAKYEAGAPEETYNKAGKITPQQLDGFKALEGGIGPSSNVKMALDAVGSLGFGYVLGYDSSTFFPEEKQMRDYLQRMNQFGKDAFIIGDRHSVYEQRLVADFLPSPKEFFENPDTSLFRLAALHDGLIDRKRFLLDQALNAAPDQRGDLTKNIQDIDDLLNMIGNPSPEQYRKLLSDEDITKYGHYLPQIGPKPGDIEDGYRFLGGDRGDENNWEKVK